MLFGGRTSSTNAEIVGGSSGFKPVFLKQKLKPFLKDGQMFTLAHSGDRSCGIPDGETFVIVGGGEQIHKFVTR